MSIAGGAPSIQDTKNDLDGYICGINGSLRYLYENGIKAQACGICDPTEYVADNLEPIDGVHYFIASMVHPKIFEKLKDQHVIMWHCSGEPRAEELLKDKYLIGGGSTMGMRWLNLGYIMGFREFHLHGMDSSYVDGRTHAYKEHERKERIKVNDRETSPNFMSQINDFKETMERFKWPDMQPTKIRLYGEGLLQDFNAEYRMRE